MQFGGEPEHRTSDQIPDQSGVGRSPGCIVSVHRPSSEVRGLTDTTSNAAEGGCCAASGKPVAAIRTSSRPRRVIATLRRGCSAVRACLLLLRRREAHFILFGAGAYGEP